jgi:hypothetical protein
VAEVGVELAMKPRESTSSIDIFGSNEGSCFVACIPDLEIAWLGATPTRRF